MAQQNNTKKSATTSENESKKDANAGNSGITGNLAARLKKLQDQMAELERDAGGSRALAEPLKTIYAWEGPDRIRNIRPNWWYLVIGILGLIGIIYVILTRDFLLVVVIFAVLALVFLSDAVDPQILKHEITNKGIVTGGQLHQWRNIEGFWIARKGSQLLLLVNLDLKSTPNRLQMYLGPADPKRLVALIEEKVPYLTSRELDVDIVSAFSLGEYQPVSTWVDVNDRATTNRRGDQRRNQR